MQRGEAEGKRNVKNVKTGASAQCERWETRWEKQRKASMCDDIETLCEELANEKVKLVGMSQAGDNGHKNIKKKKIDESQRGEMMGGGGEKNSVN